VNQRLSVLLADGLPVVLQGLSSFLRSFADINVVAKYGDGIAALEGIRKFAPNVAVLDMSMPGRTGLEILSVISRSADKTKVVILTAGGSEAELTAALQGGARGIVHKDTALEDVVYCIREVARGHLWLSPTITAMMAEYQSRTPLTGREHEIVMLMSEGLSNKEIGHRLDICEATVKIHLHHVFEKTGISKRTVLAAIVKQCPSQPLGCMLFDGFSARDCGIECFFKLSTLPIRYAGIPGGFD
jgi:two-component system nitrate/nitrite response regulator NarL